MNFILGVLLWGLSLLVFKIIGITWLFNAILWIPVVAVAFVVLISIISVLYALFFGDKK